MRAGDTASYGPLSLHRYGRTRLTVECQDSRFIENMHDRPVRQWLFHVVADAEEETLAGFLFVSIVDQTDTRLSGPTSGKMDDWDTCEEVLIKASDRVDTTRRGNPRNEPISPAEATCDDVVLRRMDEVAQYTTESATLTGALFHVLENVHYIMPSLEPADEVIA